MSNSPASPDRRARLAPVFHRFAQESRDRAQNLRSLLAASPLDLTAISREAHTLAGSGATLGGEEISRQARAMEHLTLEIQEAGRQPDGAEHQRLSDFVSALESEAAAFDPESKLDAFIAAMFAAG